MSTRKLSLQKVMSFVESVDECGIVNMDDLDKEQLLMLKSTFDAFDVDKKGFISVEMIGTIMDMLGTQLDSSELEDVIEEIDEDGNGEVSFEEFANLAARFLIEEEEDTDAIQTELKGAFRMYDREGNGFITIEVLREILQELDEKLTDDDLDSMIDEIDIDGSGTVDWEVLKKAFDTFDVEKKGSIGTQMVRTIFAMLGITTTEQILNEIIAEVDTDGSGELEFEEFVTLAAKFMVEEDAEAMQQELKEAFRLYDKEGNGYISTKTLKEILKELDDKLTNDELDMIIAEIDTDGSGTVDFDVLKNAFDTFDVEKKGSIGVVMIGTILSMLGVQTTDKMLAEIIAEVDEDGSGELEFAEFVTLASRFMVEEDAEAMQQELKEAFRLYDKEGNGYITTSTLKEILKELDDKLTSDELDMIITEIDTDGSGTVDYDEFMEVMTGGDD
ncbi:hypothetical protein D910_01815 [Dendroctonus ponderosae]|uniref:EF-hand domain-containing protein n=1 Tax=Dendroctonus ponderosae TaxID=77166 RepID=U4U340_DENPD|nr:hypothetical protein D910_01605 [Dendroctonus ponderosae]ERL84385.1 hypothetical protein D910_01815 [Dendroctonus ponderosae]KAH0999763.1 hypothetical protein HUJ05_005782 [Dendroctonus ponderosae]KAH1001377.1 hypothetical protein HUJ05_005764 [Dendroctonus ponderosae]KAH1009385.1 hypothetical protein HUJ04_001746 [Dendroctonus ponderosae]